MESIVKRLVENALRALVGISNKTRLGHRLSDQIVNNVMDQVVEVNHNGVKLRFHVPNSLNRFRAKTFSTKEPETLKWIDGFPEGSVLWDVGANVGLYSIYAAKAKRCRVYAFEPSVFNLELLARNAFQNDLTDHICLVPLALSDSLGRSKLNMTTTDWGGGTVHLWTGVRMGR